MDAKWLRDQIALTGKTQADLARALGMAPPMVNKMVKGKRGIKAAEADVIRRFFGVQLVESNVRRVDTLPEIPTRSAMPRDVPILGTAWGGESGDFTMNGETGDFARRPPRYAGRDDVFALYVQGTSMEPRYFAGELILLEKRRPPQNGDHVVVELHPGRDGTREAFLKVLVARTGTKIRLQQYNPPKTIEIDLARVGQVLRVLNTVDLLGV